jgi:hypothetical protein
MIRDSTKPVVEVSLQDLTKKNKDISVDLGKINNSMIE